jgi:hypothetical protein
MRGFTHVVNKMVLLDSLRVMLKEWGDNILGASQCEAT